MTATVDASMTADVLRLTLRDELAEIARVNAQVTDLLARHQVDESSVYAAQLALEEALSNVIRHGCDDARAHEISLVVHVEAGGVEIRIVDDGREFDPLLAPRPDLAAPLGAQRTGGRGIHLLRAFVRELGYERHAGRNALSLRI